ncbi:MAG TPA: phosphatidate cytidylyltransferase [Steroidobacteraceae bacterium]|nr:phosphatidate cytidylyltransferase [Steroidobacteraceae bacterium]
MTQQETFFAVLAALTVLLAAATALGTWLAGRTSDAVKLAWIGQMNMRIRAAWAIVLLFGIAFTVGGGALLMFFAVASFFALREFIALTPIRSSDHAALVLAFYVVIPVQYLLIAADWYAMYAVFIPVYVFLVLPVVMALRQDTEHYLVRIAKVQWGLMICVYCVSHAPAIVTLELPGFEGRGALLLLYFLLVVQMSDLLAVIASAAIGRTPLKSNPNKSREGVFAGGAAAVLLGTALFWMTPFAWWQAALMSLAIVVAGFMGGLVLTSVERSLGAKVWTDDGVLLTRGTLQRLDALTFAAPVFFHLALYFFAP